MGEGEQGGGEVAGFGVVVGEEFGLRGLFVVGRYYGIWRLMTGLFSIP